MSTDKKSKFDVAQYYDEVVWPNLTKNTKSYLDQIFSVKYEQEKVSQINALITEHQKQIDRLNHNLWINKNFGLFIKLLSFISLIALVLGVFFLVEHIFSAWYFYLIPIAGGIGFITSLVLYFVKKTRIKGIRKQIDPLQNELEQNKNQAYELLKPVYGQINRRSTFNLIEQSFSDVKLKNELDHTDLDLYQNQIITSNHSSVYSLMHGYVFSNPFLLRTKKHFHMGEKTYYGSITRTINNKTYTFSASLTKPFPVFSYETKMLFASHNFNDLEFEFLPSLRSNHELNKFYKNHPQQRMMENKEFDMLFPSIRNDEIKFRSLFTIFTQEEMVRNAQHFKILNDNFHFKKAANHLYEVNVASEINFHQWNWSSQNFRNYDPQKINQEFNNSVNKVFYGLYQYWAPIFSCSALQQERFLLAKSTKKFDVLDALNYEIIINQNTQYTNLFSIHRSHVVSDGLIKVLDVKTKKGYQEMLVKVLNYASVSKTTYVTAFSGLHSAKVPVVWDEFSAIENTFPAISYPTNEKIQQSFYLFSDEKFSNLKIKMVVKDETKTIIIFHQDTNLSLIDLKKIQTIVSSLN